MKVARVNESKTSKNVSKTEKQLISKHRLQRENEIVKLEIKIPSDVSQKSIFSSWPVEGVDVNIPGVRHRSGFILSERHKQNLNKILRLNKRFLISVIKNYKFFLLWNSPNLEWGNHQELNFIFLFEISVAGFVTLPFLNCFYLFKF